ncbi:hypothetical protein WR25_04534 [Diploscapter pachys]|uniref:Aspartyl/asparaginy/proline hydroxylase domain-containing protein n=1 Tax=Diploscapter pachys TaxID=2018661 RepID=A0A2A2LG95_9BILA|nr:hypothetical protein WR25_04534 [Diploscapter pachys]
MDHNFNIPLPTETLSSQCDILNAVKLRKRVRDSREARRHSNPVVLPSRGTPSVAMNAGVHPMTVALAPAPKVDYSVTKGGARTWAVLLVFFFLCSSLYTVFSAKEIAELAVDLDGDGEFDLDGDVNDNSDEVAANNRKTMKDTQPSTEQHVHQQESHRHSHAAPSKKAEVTPQADDEDEDESDSGGLGTQLFARLRRKMERNFKKAVDMVRNADTAEEDKEEEEVKPVRKSRAERRRKKKEEQVEQEEDQVQVKHVKPVKEAPKVEEKVHKPKESSRRARKVVEDDDSEEVHPQPVEEEEEEGDEQPEPETEESPKEEEEEPEPDHDDDAVETGTPEPVVKREAPKRQSKKVEVKKAPSRFRHITESPEERECKRKNCPQANFAEPRMWLLVHRPKDDEEDAEKEINDAVDEELEDDEDDDESEEEEEPAPQPVTELVAVKKYRSAGREAYKRHAITNRDDHRHRDNLDKADSLAEKHDYKAALKLFDAILRTSPDSPRAHFGKGRAYQIRAELTSTDKDWEDAIEEYEEVLENDETPDALFRQAASRLIECSRFKGDLHKTIAAHRALIDRFPEEIKHQTDFALTFLMMKRHEDARKILKNVLDVEPYNGIALAYYGYILKILDNDIELGVNYMRKGLRLSKDNILDPKFYYHLGQGLTLLGRDEEAYDTYSQAADLGVFLSAEQRSLYNIDGLTARPWWSVDQTGYGRYLKAIERQWVIIRHEALSVLKEHPEKWQDENEMLTTLDGHWKSFYLMDENKFIRKNCELATKTCNILEEFVTSSNATQAEIRFTVLTSSAHILPHCGPTNARLQAHLGLIIPSEARIRYPKISIKGLRHFSGLVTKSVAGKRANLSYSTIRSSMRWVDITKILNLINYSLTEDYSYSIFAGISKHLKPIKSFIGGFILDLVDLQS